MMRSWIFGKAEDKEDATQQPAAAGQGTEARPTGFLAAADAFSSLTRRGMMGSHDAEIERKVSLAARNLCYGVQRIVMAAKGKSGVEWKAELLTLLGGSDEQTPKDHCDMDILLVAPKTDKFVMRCLENELPPNMIHCLRLLRVLELQHASQKHKERELRGLDPKKKKQTPIKPISSRATAKVSQLLCTLCTDQAVGEQLRPHLFGLLALSGASYPASGVHVAKAASEVIIAFAEHCLSESLVWFLHDRKMIIHMTDDIKELCGSTAGDANNANALSLYGVDAEEYGLWAISLSTVVHLVVNSCRHQCQELLNDFEDADGNQVLESAIVESKSKHGKKLMELLPLLATCRVSEDAENDLEINSMADPNNHKLAMNPAAFEIMEDLMYRSIPLLKEYMNEHGEKPEITGEASIREFAEFSLGIAPKVRFSGDNVANAGENAEDPAFDIATDLLLACLNLFSEHTMNYELVEEHKSILSFYILSFSSFKDENLKILILKTIEFIGTGVSGSNALQPFGILSEVFVSICKALLNGGTELSSDIETQKIITDGLFKDTILINESLEKLSKFDARVGPTIIQSGEITRKIDEITTLLLKEIADKKATWLTTFEDDGKTFVEPPTSTPVDSVCAALCRILALIMGEQSKRNLPLLSIEIKGNELHHEINSLLVTAVKELGDQSAVAASGVFETIMASRESLECLQGDMLFCLKLVDHFTQITSQLCGVTGAAQKLTAKKSLKRTALEDTKFQPSRPLDLVFLRRIVGLYSMLKNVLETSSLAREAFRLSGGFESIVYVVLSLGGAAVQSESDNSEMVRSLLELFETALSVIDAAIGFNSRETTDIPDHEVSKKLAITLRADTLVDPVSTQHSPPNAAAENLYYVRVQRIYLDFAIAVSQTKVLQQGENAVQVLELAMSHMDPSFSFARVDADKNSKVQMMRNPDAARLVLGLVIFLPNTDEGSKLAKRAFDQIIRLCDPSRLGSTLSQIAGCGMIWSITNPKEFAPILNDTSHPLYTRFTLLLRRIAAFSMSYNDFVSVIRGLAGPLLTDEKSDYRIRLPVLTSSVRRRITKNEDVNSDAFKEKENDYCRRLESLSTVAERADRVPYCTLGGDSINTLSVLLHKTKVEDRLYKAAEDGRLNFLEIDCIDVSSLKPGGFLSAGVAAPGSSGGERIWTPLASSGFSYSFWFRYPKQTDENREGNIYLLDMSNQSISTGDGAHTPQSAVFFSLWYDVQLQCFNVLASTSYRGEPTQFPTSPLSAGVWHHILLTYTPTKRTMMGRKSLCALYVDGRPLEAEVKIESVNIAPNARIIVGAPNPAVAVSGVVRGMLPVWDLGPTLMLSTVLMELDATSMFIHGPEFEGLFWGDRPQRLSLSATGSAAFALLAETGEPGSVASALRRREIARLEAAGTISREMGLGVSSDEDNDSLSSLGLLCTIPPDCVVFAYRAASCNPVTAASQQPYSSRKRQCSCRLINMARINSTNEFVAADASTYGKAGVVIPRCFADNVQWAGGPQILMPLTYAANSSKSLSLALRLIRASTMRHPPNLEAMQSGGGFQTLAIIMHEKKLVDERVLDQAFAFAVHGFVPTDSDDIARMPTNRMSATSQASDFWVFSDLDAMKQLLLNHQVWDMKNAGPDLPLRLISFMNGLVGQKSVHKAFNSRRLHLVGIVRWTLHLMIEAAELYTTGEIARKSPPNRKRSGSEDLDSLDPSKPSNVWYSEAPNADAVAVGGDPDNQLLNSCKTLLRRVLTFMLTPGDLDAIAEATMHTVNIGGFNAKTNSIDKQKLSQAQALQGDAAETQKLLPGSVARIYLLRLVEELVVDGVNEIIASGGEKKEGDASRPEITVHQHSGGIANPNQSYLSTAMLGGEPGDGMSHPKHPQAQSFLSAFASVFTPVWFAALLEGCHDEATASAVLRLMILMQQSSPTFAAAFEAKGGFAPLVLSIPKFSTCPSIIISLLSQLLHVSILHLPCFPILDAGQLNEVFESESELSELMSKAYAKAANEQKSDPACGIFSLLAECLGRNVQLSPYDNNLASKARQTNKAILELLSHRHNLSPSFQAFCKTQDFIEPLAQTLCLVYDERLQKLEQVALTSQSSSSRSRRSRRGSLSEVPQGTAMERYVGTSEEVQGASGFSMVQLLRLVISNAVSSGPGAPPLVYSLFTSFPIHASAEQVGAYQLVLLDLVKSTIEDAVDLGEAAALSCSIGVVSVLLDRLMKGFFTSEPALQTVSMALTLLKDLSSPHSAAAQVVGNAELSMLTVDAAHIARLVCIAALRRSRPMNAEDPGDPDLQAAVVQMIAKNIHPLLTVPKTGLGIRRSGSSLHPAPPSNSKAYPLWLSASVYRCAPAGADVIFPDLSESEEPLRIFLVAFMVEVAVLLNDPRDNVREATISIVVALLQERRGLMSGILIKDILRGDKVETIDVMNRGGFGALLVAHEVAMSAGGSSGKKDYAAFFEWFERNQPMVQLVFDDIKEDCDRVFPSLTKGSNTTNEAVEVEQQAMVMKLSAADTSDRTIIGGLQRADIAQKCIDKTLVSHIHWKRQGFDDLASGAMQWKFLLRRLKGSRSLWEGGPRYETRSMIARHQQLYASFLSRFSPQPFSIKEDGEDDSGRELVTRWKLDLTEGCERQRRRLLPNYEFHSLYNVDENDDNLSDSSDDDGDEDDVEMSKGHKRRSTMIKSSHHIGNGRDSQTDFFISDGMEATAAILKELNIKAVKDEDDEYVEDDAQEEDSATEATSVTTASSIDGESEAAMNAAQSGASKEAKDDGSVEDAEPSESQDQHEAENASSYELITGLLQAGDWPSQSYNVRRCTGLEVRKALLLWCKDAIYVIDGFEQAEGEGLDGRITRVEKEESSYNVSIRPKDFKVSDEENEINAESNANGGDNEKSKSAKKTTQEASNTEVTYQHRSQRIAFADLHSVFRRRYQLQHNALEFYDIHNSGTLIAFANTVETEEILNKVLATPLPNSIFNSSYGTSINYKKFMASWKSKTISQWMNGKMTNFEFLMHLNSFAGRTYNDLTQYPVFPWVIADYDSEEIDLDDPNSYRDLSKPMGGLGEERAVQFRERYEALEANYFNEDEPPPFHYGTHYSCAAYVLYYLMRLEPFSRLALTLQGGRFDVADRLFHNIGSSWKSASGENLQDVRELIPEFFYLPDFLTNTNHFDFGTTQKGKMVHNVTLPKWAKGDPKRFIRINRQALESDYVSKNLHQWIDLIFGYKQRGDEAVKALNTFVHVTYEGAVDLDSMTDPIQRESTIAQIQNFGQTPSRLERKPFTQRFVFNSLKGDNIDFGSLSYLAPLTPPFCLVGAEHRCQAKRISSDTCKLGVDDQYRAVGDMCLVKGQLIGVGRMCVLHIPSKTYIRFGSPNNGITVHVGSMTARNRELNKIVSIHDSLHRTAISAAKISLNGSWLITGCIDSTVRVWKYHSQTHSLKLRATLCGHGGWKITCLDVSSSFGTIVTGCAQGRVLLWDLRTLTFVRRLDHKFKDENEASSTIVRSASSVSMNHMNGNIVTLLGPHLSVFDVNGNLLGTENSLGARPSCAVATDCPEWQDKGIVAITGHINGEVRFWSLNYDTAELSVRHLMVDREHTCEITSLRVTGVDRRQDTLLVGDQSGKMSVCKTVQLENMSSKEVQEIVAELKNDSKPAEES